MKPAGNKRGRPMLYKVLVPMLLVTLLQAGLFYAVTAFGGVERELRENAYDILEERVIGRKNYLQNEMTQRWASIEGRTQMINRKTLGLLEERHTSADQLARDSALAEELLNRASEDLLYLVRNNSVTGAFVILEGAPAASGENSLHDGLYIRDQDPETTAVNSSDLLLEVAAPPLVRNLQISLDTYWAARLELDPDRNGKFFYEPFNAAREHPDFEPSDLGYWSTPFRLNEQDLDIVTYSEPLIAGDTPYGVIGVEVSLDYFRRQLPYSELNAEKMGAYLLGMQPEAEPAFRNILSSGTTFTRNFGDADLIEMEPQPVRGSCYKIRTPGRLNDDTYASVQYLKLYNTNTPFEQQKWAVIGLIPGEVLFRVPNRMNALLVLSFIITIITGIISIFLVAALVTRPIQTLMNQMRGSDPRQPIRLGSTQITEIDELSSAIENLSWNVAESSSKFSQIIRLAEIGLGAFEYEMDSPVVLCMGRICELLNLQEDAGGMVDRSQFLERMQELEGRADCPLSRSGERLYELEDSQGKQKWIRVKFLRNDSRVLGTAVDVSKDVLEKKRIEYERDYDSLTSLLNRRAFHATAAQVFAEPDTLKTAAMLMMDLDNLKYINDTYGHDCGDNYIRSAAAALRRGAPSNCVLSRMSGDEFMMLIYGFSDQEQARQAVIRIKQSVAEAALTLPDGESFRIRLSAGVAWYPEDSADLEQLLRYADFAMYMVKNTVKGEFNEFSLESYNRDSYLLQGKEELNRLIEERLVEYVFQPIVDTRTGNVFAYEALMRSKLETLRSPMEILSLARSQSQLYLIEQLTFFEAMQEFTEFAEQIPGCRIFINSIPNQILRPQDLEKFEETFRPFLGRLVVELTEEERIERSCMLKKRKFVEKWGAQFALDDFGSGYNSESVLLTVNPSYVKVDMTIVRGIDNDSGRRRILQNLISYARIQGIQVIAEGVETHGEMMTLIALGVDYLQGYYLGRPCHQPPRVPDRVVTEIVETASFRKN